MRTLYVGFDSGINTPSGFIGTATNTLREKDGIYSVEGLILPLGIAPHFHVVDISVNGKSVSELLSPMNVKRSGSVIFVKFDLEIPPGAKIDLVAKNTGSIDRRFRAALQGTIPGTYLPNIHPKNHHKFS